jgi:hypothetical protein
MAINTVQSTDTPNAGRIKWNDNDTLLQAEIDAVSAALTTHETSADHDSRYYTKTYIDADLAVINNNVDTLDSSTVKITGDQTVAGAKTFTADVKVKKDLPSVIIASSDETLRAKFTGGVYSGLGYVGLQIDNGAPSSENWEWLLTAYQNAKTIDIPNRKLTVDGQELATISYVQQRIKTGLIVLTASLTIPSVSYSTSYYFKNHNGDKLRFVVPQSCILKGLSLIRTNTSGVGVDQDVEIDHTFNNVGAGNASARIIIPQIQIFAQIPGTGTAAWQLNLYSALASGSGGESLITSTEIALDAIADSSEHIFEISMVLAI